MSRLILPLALASMLVLGIVLVPAAARAEPVDQRGQVTINVTPHHGIPFGFRAPVGFGFVGFRLPPMILLPPPLPPPVLVPLPVLVPVPAYTPPLPPALPLAAPCGCASP